MIEEAEKKKLYDAVVRYGDEEVLQKWLVENPKQVGEVSFACSRNLLHLAAMHGHENIVDVLRSHRQLARDLDSQNSTPLHIAAANGRIFAASKLLLIAPETCWWRDCHGMNPVHVAAVNGRVSILEEMFRVNSTPSMERVHRGETVLHLCIKHDRLEALQFLVDKLGELVCAKNDDGDTILHLAVRFNQPQVT